MASLSQLTDFSPAIRWFRRNLTGPGLIDGLKTAVWVVPLTILIWVYAEQQQTAVETNQTIPIEIPHLTSDGNRVVTLVEKGDDIPMAELRGSKSHLETVKAELIKPGDNRLVRIDVPADLPDGLNYLNIGPQIQKASVFTNNGVTVSNVHRDPIRVMIDTLETREIEVKAATTTNLADTPVFDPPRVKVRAPRKSFDDPEKLKPFVQIPTSGELARPGTHPPIILPVEVALKTDDVTITPSNVSATFTIKQNDTTFTIDSMPVRHLYAFGVENEGIYEGEDFVRNVTIQGPPDEIAKIASKEKTPFAILYIERSDVGKEHLSKRLEFNLQELQHVTVIEPDKSKPFEYTVRKRTP